MDTGDQDRSRGGGGAGVALPRFSGITRPPGPPTAEDLAMPTITRLAPLTGAAGIACAVAGLAMDTAPTSSWPDARITAWYAANGNGHWLLSAYLIAAAAPFLLLFTAVVRDRLARA